MGKYSGEILKKHISNMNEFCGENIGFEQGKEQLKMMHRYYVKRFPGQKILYKNLIILKNEINSNKMLSEDYYKNTCHWMKYFISCSDSEWKELWQAI